MSKSFPIELIFPPQGHFTQPYLALPCLKAWLVEQGFSDVRVRDLAIESYDYFLTPEYLQYATEKAAGHLDWETLDGQDELPFRDMRAWRSAVESRLTGQSVGANINAAKAVIRGPEFFEPERYVPAVRTLYAGLRLVSAAHYPSELTPHNFTMGYANDRSDEVLAATLDGEQNPFLRYFEQEVLPGLIERKPRVVGMSVIYGSQLIPALTLGRMIKKALPDCHVTAGGGFLAYIGKKLMHAPDMHHCLDSMIFHEGEIPLQGLCETLREAGTTPTDLGLIGSLTWFDRHGFASHGLDRRKDGEPTCVENPPGHPVHLDKAPVPDFSDLPLQTYFSPETVLPYDINRGCYYGECAFCTLPTVIGPGYRTRSAETITQQVLQLRDQHGCTHFNFITDCMPSGMIRDLPEALIENKANITWWSDARVEPKAYDQEGAKRLYDSGCRKLLFGFETATPRLLKMMKKGQSLRSVTQVVQNCADAGISVTLYAMVGFPSETREEARATLKYIEDSVPAVREVSLQTFHIDEVALTYREPERFGIQILDDPLADLQLYHDYESEVGMTQGEAAEMFEEMMGRFAEVLPIFSGDSILYFMQKSHYFLHLARGTSPDEFAEMCVQRTLEKPLGKGDVIVPGDLQALPIQHGYNRVLRTLADPLARAARPDFLTGRFVGAAEELASQQLPGAPMQEKCLVFVPDRGEFVELARDGWRLLQGIRQAGSLARFFEAHPSNNPAVQSRLAGFVAQVTQLGLLKQSGSGSLPEYLLPAPIGDRLTGREPVGGKSSGQEAPRPSASTSHQNR